MSRSVALMTDTQSVDPDRTEQPARAEYRAAAAASSPNPQDWGRAVQIALQDLAQQAQRNGYGSEVDALLGADIRLHIEGTDDGVRVTAVWPAEASPES